MDRGTKLMMALSSMLGALGVAGIVIFAFSVGYGRFSSSMIVLLLCSLMSVYCCYILQKCISCTNDSSAYLPGNYSCSNEQGCVYVFTVKKVKS